MLPCNPGGHAAFQDTFVSQLPVTAPLSVLPHSSAKSASAIVRRKAVLPVTANAIIPSPTVTGDGTPTGNAISSATTSTYMWLPIPTVTFLYFLF